MDQVFSKENKTLKKILENWKKILEKSGNFVSPEKWEPWLNGKYSLGKKYLALYGSTHCISYLGNAPIMTKP